MKKDQEGDTSAALSLYCKALEYFVPALYCESIPGRVHGSWAVLGRGGSTPGEACWQPTPCSTASLSIPR